MAVSKQKAAFVKPMLLQRTDALPEDAERWLYEIKMDGYRAIAFKTNRKIHLRSRNDNDFALKYPNIVQALSALPDDTVLDGEVVALDEAGKPSFNTLQNHGSAPDTPLFYFVFDLLMLAGKSVIHEPLLARRTLLEDRVLGKLAEPIRYSLALQGSLRQLVAAVKEQNLEGLVAKQRDSSYEPGLRSGAWQKMRVNQGQELVIGGYTVGARNFDALILGYFEAGNLMYASRTPNGFTPVLRDQLFRRIIPLAIAECPFANLPEKHGGRWGQGLTAAKMKECRWIKPELVGQFEFVEWTQDNHLRHTKFVALREDKKARDVTRERS